MSDGPLIVPPKKAAHKVFADAYLAQPTGQRNQGEAYRVAFPKASSNGSRVSAARLIRQPDVACYIESMELAKQTSSGIAIVNAIDQASRELGYRAKDVVMDLIMLKRMAMGDAPCGKRMVKDGKKWVEQAVYRASYPDAQIALDRLLAMFQVVTVPTDDNKTPGTTVNIAVLPATATPDEWLRLHSPPIG